VNVSDEFTIPRETRELTCPSKSIEKPLFSGEKGLGGGGACEVILVVDMVEREKK